MKDKQDEEATPSATTNSGGSTSTNQVGGVTSSLNSVSLSATPTSHQMSTTNSTPIPTTVPGGKAPPSSSNYSPISSLLNALSGAASSAGLSMGTKSGSSSTSATSSPSKGKVNSVTANHSVSQNSVIVPSSSSENHVTHPKAQQEVNPGTGKLRPELVVVVGESEEKKNPTSLPQIQVVSDRRPSATNLNGPGCPLRRPIKLKNHSGHGVECYDTLHFKNPSQLQVREKVTFY